VAARPPAANGPRARVDAGRRYISLDAIAWTLAPQDPEATVEVAMIAA